MLLVSELLELIKIWDSLVKTCYVGLGLLVTEIDFLFSLYDSDFFMCQFLFKYPKEKTTVVDDKNTSSITGFNE